IQTLPLEALRALLPAYSAPPQAPSAAAPLRPHPLPKPLSSLVGRESALAELRQKIEAPDTPESPAVRVLTLLGPGGAGKTHLAQVLARQVSARFKDGVGWVRLGQITDPEQVLLEIAKSLGLVRREPVLPCLEEGLQSREFLLILDNFEQLLRRTPACN